MRNKLLLHSIRKIKDNYKRFLSLFFMSLLGVGFFVGIKATSPDMINALDKFHDENNIYDIQVVSNMGLTDKDISILEDVDGVSAVIGSYTKDDFLKLDSREYAVRLMSIEEDVNEIYVKKGRIPKNNNEIIVDSKLLRDNKLKIGDKVEIGDKSYKIVGEGISPLYYSMDRGFTNIGNGQIKYYAYVVSDVIKSEYYTNLYILVDEAKKYVTNDSNYKDKVYHVYDEINRIKPDLEDRRYNEVYKDIIDMSKMMNVSIPKDSIKDVNIDLYLRDDNQAYNDVVDASVNVGRIGDIFPLVFYVIAILISLITMMRMVEEDRLENGTMKALGYKTSDVLIKYLLFSFTATVLGGIIGVFIGCNLIPRIIWNIYQMMFTVPYFSCDINVKYTIIGLGIAVICICGSAVFTCVKNLKNVPANLMRPKSPKAGKRVLLEKIPFIWSKFNFSQKITLRNIFRYKSRVLATLLGIAGCTALILAGFGLRDAVSNIVNYQFERVFHYDRMVTLSNDVDLSDALDNDIVDFYTPCFLNDTIIEYNKKQDNVNLIVSDDYNSLNKVISLYDIDNNNNNKNVIPKDNQVIISEKTRNVFGVDVGDYLYIEIDNQKKKVNVSNVVENYVGQYIFLNKETYNDLFGEYENNTYYINLDKDFDSGSVDEFDKDILSTNGVSGLVNSNEIIDLVNKTMKSLDSVVVVLIVAAALLALVVLYNLSNINICEREREIATLKVLGFYNKEVDDYITKESIILSVVGIIIGLVCGKYLSNFIISTCEPDTVMFVRDLSLFSYIISACLTSVFMIVINMITHFSLLKIDMIESLKNVE